MSETSKQHKEHAPKKLNYAIYICSSSRYHQMEKGENVTDLGGDTIQNMVQSAGNKVLYKKIIADDKEMIIKAFKDCLTTTDLDVAIFSGGTGITPTDVTIEAVSPLLEKTLPGFGEFFRRISFDEVGPAAVLSRAVAGVAGGKAFFCIPGSPNAVKTAVEKLILPESPHIVKHARETR
ncbi:MAG: MogA/MoaB family molybdenum cofactor biosynthesis protein [Candidatus Bathyarchaeia archaeon]|jgi:molybdenum cofactor biosynthesis protein B